MGVLKGALLALGLAACAFDPDLAGQYACGVNDACPPGLVCAADQLCRQRVDAGDDLATHSTVIDLARSCPSPPMCSDDHCGDFLDACGEIVSCTTICHGKNKLCGGGGANRCGDNACLPTTCASQSRTCGRLSDGCTHVLDCGPPC